MVLQNISHDDDTLPDYCAFRCCKQHELTLYRAPELAFEEPNVVMSNACVDIVQRWRENKLFDFHRVNATPLNLVFEKLQGVSLSAATGIFHKRALSI